MMLQVKRPNCEVWLEGVKVPFNTVQIAEAVDLPPMATVIFPSSDEIMRIMPKTIIHVFYDQQLVFQGELVGYGLSRQSDKRTVQLQFSGLTKNWQTNVMIPMDAASFPTMLNNSLFAVNYMDETDDSKAHRIGIKFFAEGLLSPINQLANIVSASRDTSMSELMTKLLDALQYTGIYYKYWSGAFKIQKQILTINSNVAKEILTSYARLAYLKQTLLTRTGAQPIASVITDVLNTFGYDIVEMAAPTLGDDGSPKSIFIKPQTYSFSPIMCNTVFNDQISMMNFNRDADGEPTRLINFTMPFVLAGDDQGLASTVLSTIVPKGLLAYDLLKNGNATDRFVKLTEEERCRGINLASHTDETGIEEAYQYTLFFDKPKLAELLEKDNLTVEFLKKINNVDEIKTMLGKWDDDYKPGVESDLTIFKESNEFEKLVSYHLMDAIIAYINKRGQHRTLNIHTYYSPYRVVGLPGVILDKDFAPMTGVLHDSVAVISADGSTTQVLNFVNVKVVPPQDFSWKAERDKSTSAPGTSQANTAPYGFMDEVFTEPPAWFHEFNYKTIGTNFYGQVTGRPYSSLYEKTNEEQFNTAVRTLQTKYEESNDKFSFIEATTQRRLCPMSTIIDFLGTDTRSLENDTLEDSSNPKPYVDERRNRVKKIFGANTYVRTI